MITIIELYIQPSCGPCHGAEAWLTAHNVEFTSYDVTTDQKALDTILDLGYAGTPVIKKGNKHFAGFDINKIKELI
jgi:glutaredoxin-like protein NrdH